MGRGQGIPLKDVSQGSKSQLLIDINMNITLSVTFYVRNGQEARYNSNLISPVIPL